MTLELTTKIQDPEKLLLDGEEYVLYGLDHISRDVETEAVAAFARFARLSRRLDVERDRVKAKKVALALAEARGEILSLLTNIPADVADGLPVSVQVKILEALQELMESGDRDVDLEEEPEDGTSPSGDDDL